MQSQRACASQQIEKLEANDGINNLFSVANSWIPCIINILLQAISYCHLKMLSYDLAHIYIIKIMLTYTG